MQYFLLGLYGFAIIVFSYRVADVVLQLLQLCFTLHDGIYWSRIPYVLEQTWLFLTINSIGLLFTFYAFAVTVRKIP